jgi:cytochrome c-type biogenesis protein CcmH/NrfG
MSHKCHKCGADIPQDAKFCPECGAKTDSKEKKINRPAPQKPAGLFKGYNVIYLVALASLIVVGIYGYRFIMPAARVNPHTEGQPAAAPQAPPPMDPAQFNALKAAVDANPAGVGENIELANYLFDHQRFGDAIKYYEKSLESNPNNADVLVDAGVCDFNLQNFTGAKQYFENALKVNDKHPNALYNLGVVSAQLGDMSGMLDAWNKLIAVAPQSEVAQNARQLMDQVRGTGSNN